MAHTFTRRAALASGLLATVPHVVRAASPVIIAVGADPAYTPFYLAAHE